MYHAIRLHSGLRAVLRRTSTGRVRVRHSSYFVESHIGLRNTNEDAYAILSNEDDSLSIYAVYDGHAGGNCSAFLAENLADRVYAQLSQGDVSDVGDMLQQTFLDVDEEFCYTARRENRMDGSTALMAVLRRDPSKLSGELWVANAGDCRAVLVRASTSTEQLSTDHKAMLEKERIEAEGGFVTVANGIGRVNGAVSAWRMNFKRFHGVGLKSAWLLYM